VVTSIDHRRTLFLVLVSMPFWVGCDGCRRSLSPDAAESKTTTAAETFTFASLAPMPASGTITTTSVKPGHWVTFRQSIRSNQDDERGDLTFSIAVVDPTASGWLSPGASGWNAAAMSTTRPAVLPKGRMKRLDVRMLAPSSDIDVSRRISTVASFNSGATLATSRRVDHNVMRGDEYFFVVLTTRPERFAAWQSANWARSATNDEFTNTTTNHYSLVFPRQAGTVAMPESMLDMTNTAIVFWDDLPPSELTPQQQTALTDWLCFGGRMIVNGHSSSTALATSKLAPLLPIAINGMATLDVDDVTQLVNHYQVADDRSVPATIAVINEQASRISIAGPLSSDAAYLTDASNTIAKKRFGRGEVVMSRFDLTSDWMRNWDSMPSFFNTALLARPPRNFVQIDGVSAQRWTVGNEKDDANSVFNTSLRLASRNARLIDPSERGSDNSLGSFVVDPISGLGGWRDQSDIARMLQSTLRENAGIVIPPVRYVMKVFAIFLTILIPLNYLVFWLINRLEWAWVAIPFIALGGAGWIARSLSLDLGLARTASEVSLVELHAGHSRAHLTRFTSIYNSLSAAYQLQFDAPESAAAAVDPLGKQSIAMSQPILRYGFTEGPILDNISVPSNRTRLVHAEQIVDVGGTITLDGQWLRNDTMMMLEKCVVCRTDTMGEVGYAVVDDLQPAARAAMQWRSQLPADSTLQAQTTLARSLARQPGSTCLAARYESRLTGMNIVPETPMQNAVTYLVAHLEHAPVGRSRGDVNLQPKPTKSTVIVGDDESFDEANPSP